MVVERIDSISSRPGEGKKSARSYCLNWFLGEEFMVDDGDSTCSFIESKGITGLLKGERESLDLRRLRNFYL